MHTASIVSVVKRLAFVAVFGLAVLAGCSSGEQAQESPSTSVSTSTTQPAPPTITGAVILSKEESWNLFPLDWLLDQPEDFENPTAFRNGDECRSSIFGGANFIHTKTQIVAKDSRGEIVGIARLGTGSVAGLSSAGYDVPGGVGFWESDEVLRDMRIEGECVFPFSIGLTHESPFYSVGIERSDPEDQREVKYTQDELDSAGWVVTFRLR